MAFETAPPATPTSWMKRLRWGIGGLLLLWVLLALLVPPLVKREIEREGTAALGRKVSVGEVGFQPWSLRLTVNDLKIGAAEDRGWQFTLARLEANLELESLLRMAPVLDSLVLDIPHLNLMRTGDGHYDIDDVLQRLNKPSATPASKPLQFALYNVRVTNGSADFTDTLTSGTQKHALRKLTLSIPFLSNLEYRRTAQIQPHLAFELNGSNFDTALQGTPFDTSHAMEARLKVPRFDLAPWLPYVPADLAVRPTAGVLDADLRIAFTEAPKASVTVSGHLGAAGLVLKDAAGAEVLRTQTIAAELDDVRPLERVATLASLTLEAPALRWVRKRAGRLKVDLLDVSLSEDATKTGAANAQSTPPTGTNDAKSPAKADDWKFTLHALHIARGQVGYADENFKPTAAVALTDVDVQVNALQWPLTDKAVAFKASANVPAKSKTARLQLQGDATAAGGTTHVQLNDGALALAEPWLSDYLVPKLRGTLDTELDVRWQGEAMQIAIAKLALSEVALVGAAAPVPTGAPRSGPSSNDMPRIQSLELQGATIDLGARSAALGKVTARAPSSGVRRSEDGRWMFQSWMKTQKTSADDAPAAQQPWRVQMDGLTVSDGVVTFSDRSKGKPVRMEVSGLSLQTGPLDIVGKEPVQLTLAARLRSGQTEAGSLKFKGTAAWAPVQLRGELDATDVPAHALVPYFAERLNLDILRADVSVRGRLRYADTPAGAEVNLRADAALEEFRANNAVAAEEGSTLALGDELLSWKALNVPGIALNMTPGKPMRLQVREAALTDFFARIAVAPDGRINLQDLVKPAPQGMAAEPVGPPAQITVGPVTLVQGKVMFSDRFVKPNYSADLSALTGKLGQFATQAAGAEPQLADLELRGRAEGTAALEITGKINPLAQPLMMDIQAQVRDLELPPLSPYAIKYAGYGIDRGKMSVTAQYKVERDGQLNASNKVVLNQLAFGEAVEGSPNSLPVKLVTALLADENGMIDLDLPISGSLNDPQFSVGPVIWKVITNIIAKALTSPFSLLGGSGGANESGGRIAFAPGSSALDAQAVQALDKLVQSVGSKAALALTVTGTAQLEAEREALKRERLKALLLAEKRRRQAQDAATVTTITDEEAPALLRTVYRRAEINKPRNILGFVKELEPREMENLLLASITVDADAMRALAQARAVAVKDYLAARQFPAERLFLGGVKVEEAPPSGSAFQPAAELALSHR